VRFWLGTHEVGWLERMTVPLFISRVRLEKRKVLPRARGPWALDSGGFTQLNQPPHRWTLPADEYADVVALYASEVGNLAWAAPQDWMCEPWIVERTGLSVREHQERTVANYLELRDRGPFVPVLQGWTLEDYEACIALYTDAGVDLTAAPLVGLGTVCRRQATPEIARIVGALAGRGLRLHGFGMKSRGLARVAHLLESADSMAWSFNARMAWQHEKRQLCGGGHRGSCANCSAWALRWRDGVVDGMGLFGIPSGVPAG
jgi:hypothetical protein